MDESSLTRHTTDEDPQGLPCSQVFVQNGRRVWYDLNFVFVALHGSPSQDRKQFLRECTGYWMRAGLRVGVDYFFRSKTTPSTQVANVCNGLALYWLIASRALSARIPKLRETALQFMTAAVVRGQQVAESCSCTNAEHVPMGNLLGRQLLLSGDFMTVSGLHCAAGGLHREAVGIIAELWEGMGLGSFQAPEHKLRDVVTFSLSAARFRRTTHEPFRNQRLQEWITALGRLIVECVATLMEAYVLKVYLPGRASKSAPAYRSPLKPLKQRRVYTQVHPASIWALIEKADGCGCSLATYIRTRKDDPEAGASEAQAGPWMKKLHKMYAKNRSLWFAGARHLNLVADPSTHSKYETMVSIAWSWEEGVGAIADIQRMPATSTVLNADMPDRIAELWAKNRLERVATYQQLQAVSNTILGLGPWQCGLEEFNVPQGFTFRAVDHDEVRIVCRGEDGDVDNAMFHNKRDDSYLPVFPLVATRGFASAAAQAPRAAAQGPPEAAPRAATQGSPEAAPRAATQGPVPGLAPTTETEPLRLPLLVLSLDQGSLGAAGFAFLESYRHMMVTCKWDKFHRVVRDIKLSMARASGLFLKAQLFTAFLWSLNYKPYGTGVHGTKKKEALDYFLSRLHEDSAVFLKYGPRIAEDNGMGFSTPEDRRRLFENLPQISRSFVQATGVCKLGRWFSWNDCAKEQLPEFWAARMILEHFLAATSTQEVLPDPDLVAFDNLEELARAATAKTPQEELRQLKSANGGLLLAYKLMTRDCLQYARILYIATQGCWSWYSSQVNSVKTPADGITDLVASTRRGWGNDPHLADTVKSALQDPDNLAFMGIEEGESVVAIRLLTLTLAIVSHRGWSLAHRCHGPPECYVGILPLAAMQGLDKVCTAATMRAHWQRLLQLEQRRLTYGPAKQLWDDIAVARNSAIRAMYCLFERDQFRPSSIDGCHLLRGLLEVLPDNKIVEDSHNVIRADAAKCRGDKRNVTRIQDVNLRSKVLETRGVPHPARVRANDFVRNFKMTRPVDSKSRYWSCRHRMPAVQAHVMGKKTWPTVSEQWLRRNAAAWEWLQVGSLVPCRNAGTRPNIASALFSRLTSQDTVIMRADNGKCLMCLGHAEWAFLSWPIDTVATAADTFRTMRLSTVAGVTLEHIVDPSEWHVVPYAPRMSSSGIVLQQVAMPVPLLRHVFATSNSLSFRDLQHLADFLQVDRRGSRTELLARVVGAVDASMVEGVLLADKVPVSRRISATDRLLDDELFEAAFDQLDDNDKKLEFRDIVQEQERKRCRAKRALKHVTFSLDKHKAKSTKRKAPLLQRRVKKARLADAPAAPLLERRVKKARLADAPAASSQAASSSQSASSHSQAAANLENPLDASVAGAVARASPPPPEASPLDVADAPPAAAAAVAGRSAEAAPVAAAAERHPRGVPCGRFIIAPAFRKGLLEAITCTCLLHKQGPRCNKNLTLGNKFTHAQATLRIKEWCARGIDIEDGPDARELHMAIHPRFFKDGDIRSVAELDRLVGRADPLP